MRRQSAVRVFSSCFAVTSLWAGIAHGQTSEPVPPSAEPPASAPAPATSSLFDQGMASLGAGDHRAAVEAFNAAYLADGNVAALFNLGIAYTNLGMLTHAVESLTRYVARADAARDAQTIAAVEQEIARLRAENGVVVVNLVPAEAAVRIDEVSVSPLNGELIVAPGKRRFEVFADGHVSYDQAMQVQAGRFSLDVTLVPVSEAPVALPAPETHAAQPSVVKPSEDADPSDAEEPEENLDCLLSNVCIGPVLSLLGPPNLVGGGVHVRLGRYFGASVDYQMTPRISFDPVSMSASLFSVNARVYPFGGAFFISGGFGQQTVNGRFSNEDLTIDGSASFPALMASIGFMGRDGFVMGIDLGVLVPVGSTSVSIGTMQLHREVNGQAIPQSEIDKARGDVAEQVGRVVDLLPVSVQVNLLRIGYMF